MIIYNSSIYNCQNLERTQISCSGWVDKQTGTSIQWNTTQQKIIKHKQNKKTQQQQNSSKNLVNYKAWAKEPVSKYHAVYRIFSEK